MVQHLSETVALVIARNPKDVFFEFLVYLREMMKLWGGMVYLNTFLFLQALEVVSKIEKMKTLKRNHGYS